MAEAINNVSSKRIAVVTGANKGIGLEICRQLASQGVTVVLTARDEGRGTEAVEKLKNSEVSDVLFHQLDVADPASVASLANFIKTQFGKLDILVNNAGVGGMTGTPPTFKEEENGFERFMKLLEVAKETPETAEECLNINYYGMKRVTEALIPFLQQAKAPRIVNVTSIYGQLRSIPGESIKKAMGDVDEKTEARLDETLQSYVKELKEGKLNSVWPTKPTCYILSKAAMNTYTRLLAKRFPSACVNCVAPGSIKTDINYNTGILTAEEGAKGPVMLALLPDGGPSGLFYDQSEIVPFE
ncbi:salutaridine reductase-like [Asparagus officinalis]|uniref:salutaridine reductase-like n=1 Tax=Asparagus officinalis TaxID=4686 RepID=UPI00098E3A09|nr:salutaridine reductase-like [Asparagus officinalis]